jgi:hypothetical protein
MQYLCSSLGAPDKFERLIETVLHRLKYLALATVN